MSRHFGILPSHCIKFWRRLPSHAERPASMAPIKHWPDQVLSEPPVLFALHWLPVCQRIKFKMLTVVSNCVQSQMWHWAGLPQELMQPYRQGRELRSASHHLLNVPFTKSTVISNRAFGVAGPSLCNGLPRYIRAITTLTVFKSRLKTNFFTES